MFRLKPKLKKAPICKVIYDEKQGKVLFESVVGPSSSLDEIIQYDKNYGKLPLPADGIVTYKFYGELPRGVTEKSLERAFRLALTRVMRQTTAIKDARRAKDGETPTFRIYTHTTADDENLQGRTIMYAYFPFNTQTNGVIVINRLDFYFTLHGNGTSMYDIDPVNYPPDTKSKGATIDMDVVFAHELKHLLGLPHDPLPANNLSANYSFISEYDTDRDTARVHAKYPPRTIPQRLKDRFLASFRIVSDR